jgi:hypothetical protein
MSNLQNVDLICDDEIKCGVCGLCTTVNDVKVFDADPHQTQCIVFDVICFRCISTLYGCDRPEFIAYCNKLEADVIVRQQNAHDMWTALNEPL